MVEQKVIQTAADTLYPAVFGLFRDHGGTADERVVCDRELPARIAAYIQHSAAQMERIDQHLASQLASTDSVIVWGAGQLAMKVLALPCFARTKVCALVDNNSILRGKTLAGAPIIGPHKIGTREIAGASAPIIIATLLHAEEIRDQIRHLGLSNPVLSLLQNSGPQIHSEVRRS